MCMTALLVSMAIGLADAPTENPYAKAKVGDSVSHKMIMANAPAGIPATTIKKTVTAKTDDSVTIKVETMMGDMAMQPQEMKVNLKEKYDPAQGPNKDTKSEVKKLGDGKEKVTVGGKSYDCTWSATEVTTTHNGTKYTAKTKVWMCKDVPLDGIVKTETEANGQKTSMELVATAAGK